MTVASTPLRLSNPSTPLTGTGGGAYAGAWAPTHLLHVGYRLDYLGDEFLSVHIRLLTQGKNILHVDIGAVTEIVHRGQLLPRG